jgi:hypothetical protein
MKDPQDSVAAKGDLPVNPCYLTAHKGPEKRGFYSASELERRGWSYHMVRTFLKPDSLRQNMRRRTRRRGNRSMFYQCSPLEYEYSLAQVLAVEATPKWQKAKARAARKRASGPKTRYYPTSPLPIRY